jgi:two-component system chemotaxis response regulator CheY
MIINLPSKGFSITFRRKNTYSGLIKQYQNRLAIMKKRILIVDDDLSILKLLNFILSKDYEIIVRNNGMDAFSWLEEGNIPELIISDLQMPYFDGQSFIKNVKISGLFRDIPIIMLSAAHDLDEQVTKMPFNIDAYMPKPFKPASLKAAINHVISIYDTTESN